MTIGTNEPLWGEVRVSAAEAAEFEQSLSAKRTVELPSNQQMFCTYTSTDGQPEYVGYAPKGLAQNVDGWILHKFTYDQNRQCLSRQIAYGNWTDRESEVYE